MYILDAAEKTVYSSEAIERFVVSEKSDAVLVVASLGPDRCGTLGRYHTMEEAKGVIYRLYCALASGEKSFDMPKAVTVEQVKRDARTKRKGGS
jgi:hypothetical protein